MHLTTNQTKALGDVMRLLAEATDGDALREALALPMLDLLGADQYASMAWNARASRFEAFTALNLSADSLRRWDEYYRFVDPLTLPMMARRRPTVATQILRQPELVRTEFFNDFLRPEQMHWGINVYFYDRDTCVGDFRIWRKRERGNFDANEVEILRLVEPAIAAALGRLHWQRHASPQMVLTERAEELLQRNTRLSDREAQVAWLVSCGCPDKLIARRLAVGYSTVRFHLANAFRKLHVDNRAALASRVQGLVDALRQGAPDADARAPGIARDRPAARGPGRTEPSPRVRR